MANTFTQIHVQFVFAVQNRTSLIKESWKTEIYKYLAASVQNKGHKMIILNGMPDHLHMLVGFKPTESISHFMQEVKSDSSSWINQNDFITGKFQWQEGYGAFSYSRSQLPELIRYIQNQELHHKTKTFLEEYKELLLKFEIDYEEKYIFKPVL